MDQNCGRKEVDGHNRETNNSKGNAKGRRVGTSSLME
jgi:hypothetical protein